MFQKNFKKMWVNYFFKEIFIKWLKFYNINKMTIFINSQSYFVLTVIFLKKKKSVMF